MKNQKQKDCKVETSAPSEKKVGANMARLLDSREVKQVSGADSGPSPRGPGH